VYYEFVHNRTSVLKVKVSSLKQKIQS
jgi:hypothetical protein